MVADHQQADHSPSSWWLTSSRSRVRVPDGQYWSRPALSNAAHAGVVCVAVGVQGQITPRWATRTVVTATSGTSADAATIGRRPRLRPGLAAVTPWRAAHS